MRLLFLIKILRFSFVKAMELLDVEATQGRASGRTDKVAVIE
jgi:hypothetical protein